MKSAWRKSALRRRAVTPFDSLSFSFGCIRSLRRGGPRYVKKEKAPGFDARGSFKPAFEVSLTHQVDV
jgi:hypothetical protein